jgi:predicted Zn finger-like uncharacterized protein
MGIAAFGKELPLTSFAVSSFSLGQRVRNPRGGERRQYTGKMMMTGEQQLDMPCKNCGKSFAIFLRQMAAHNQNVVCPHCGQEHDYTPAGVTPAAPARQTPRKTQEGRQKKKARPKPGLELQTNYV